jgi:hypothetical protein
MTTLLLLQRLLIVELHAEVVDDVDEVVCASASHLHF